MTHAVVIRHWPRGRVGGKGPRTRRQVVARRRRLLAQRYAELGLPAPRKGAGR